MRQGASRGRAMKHIVVLNSFAHRDGGADFGAEGWQVTTLRANPDPALDDAAALAAVAGAEALYVSLPGRITADLIARMPKLKVISVAGAGYQNVDLAAATEHGVAVVNHSGVGHIAVAEHMVAMLLALTRRLPTTHSALVNDGWKSRATYMKRVSDSFGTILAGKTAGIVGLGNIGARLAKTLLHGFDMKVSAFSPATPQDVFDSLGVTRVADINALCRESDCVLVVTNYTPEKHHLVGRAQIAAMKPTAILINAGRGPLVDQQALHEALQDGTIAAAGLDVFDPEPALDGDPLFKLDNILVTPHVAGLADEVQRALVRSSVEQCGQVLDGQRPPRLVNDSVWGKRRA